MTPAQTKQFNAMREVAGKCAEAIGAMLGTLEDIQVRLDELESKIKTDSKSKPVGGVH
jgi:uncharacterized protein YukE